MRDKFNRFKSIKLIAKGGLLDYSYRIDQVLLDPFVVIECMNGISLTCLCEGMHSSDLTKRVWLSAQERL
jgi:hypothetical protein